MCGIIGFIKRSGSAAEVLNLSVQAMAAQLTHRGPDDSGSWADPKAGVALGHRRLSIIDLSAAGHQPMVSASGRFVLAFNGEIYNHLEIRSALMNDGAAPAWRGHSDTETLLAGIERWGPETTLKKLTGMFAFALWDTHESSLTLTRDRIGEKPLYYGWTGRGEARAFVFGSELKALKAYSGFDSAVSREALAQYLRFTYVPAPFSIYQNIFKLEPGCLLTVKGAPPFDAPSAQLRVGERYKSIELQRWWSLTDTIKHGQSLLISSDQEAIDRLEDRLSNAVSSQLISDVPLGAFLSGGIDSSSIVALMQRQSSHVVKTFTIGFDEAGFDESPHARAVAEHLGTDHHEMRVSAQMARDVIPHLSQIYDEPFADSSQIPTYLVSKLARQHVTVALSGDAGDELFGGYNRYFWGQRIWSRLAWMPFSVRKMLAKTICAIPAEGLDHLSGVSGVSRLGDRAHKLAVRLSSVRSMDDLYWSLVTEWADPAALVRGVGGVVRSPWESNEVLPPGLNSVERMMFRDALTYLPDDILCKVDRAAMVCSLETRVPFLDHGVIELAWQIPLHMKIRDNTSKWALRQVLYRYVPKELIERPKAGFAIPVGQWLRGPLRDWAENLLGEARLDQEGYFHPEPIRKAWREHLSGRHDHTPKIWSVLMFQAWLEAQAK
jgi:asparagine synthase (glutamine-hydrolysing)